MVGGEAYPGMVQDPDRWSSSLRTGPPARATVRAQQEWNVGRVMCGGLGGLPTALAAEHRREKWEVSWEQTGRALGIGTGPGEVARAGQGQRA